MGTRAPSRLPSPSTKTGSVMAGRGCHRRGFGDQNRDAADCDWWGMSRIEQIHAIFGHTVPVSFDAEITVLLLMARRIMRLIAPVPDLRWRLRAKLESNITKRFGRRGSFRHATWRDKQHVVSGQPTRIYNSPTQRNKGTHHHSS